MGNRTVKGTFEVFPSLYEFYQVRHEESLQKTIPFFLSETGVDGPFSR